MQPYTYFTERYDIASGKTVKERFSDFTEAKRAIEAAIPKPLIWKEEMEKGKLAGKDYLYKSGSWIAVESAERQSPLGRITPIPRAVAMSFF